MLRIGICDDLADARLVLRSLLERILENRKIQGQFFEFSSGETLLRWYDHHAGELDIIFLDMELHEIDGMETARRLRNADTGLQLVFVTGYADHVFDGYSVGALGYLLKPPKPKQLEAVLDRAQAALYRDLERAYICRSGDTHYRIPISTNDTWYAPGLWTAWKAVRSSCKTESGSLSADPVSGQLCWPWPRRNWRDNRCAHCFGIFGFTGFGG